MYLLQTICYFFIKRIRNPRPKALKPILLSFIFYLNQEHPSESDLIWKLNTRGFYLSENNPRNK